MKARKFTVLALAVGLALLLTLAMADLYWCQEGAISNTDGDTVYLYDAAWVLANHYSY